jgi:hypothetical protein
MQVKYGVDVMHVTYMKSSVPTSNWTKKYDEDAHGNIKKINHSFFCQMSEKP